MEPTLGALLGRIERLETANTRLRSLVLVAFAVLAFLGFTAAATTSNGPMIIRGPGGHSIHILGDYIAFEDSTGTSRMSIGLTPNGDSMIDVRDHNGKTRARFGLSSSGAALLSMFDASGTERTFVGSYTDGSYGLSLSDRSGVERAYLGSSSSDNPQLRLRDSTKADRVFLGYYKDGTFGETIYSSSGSSLWHAP